MKSILPHIPQKIIDYSFKDIKERIGSRIGNISNSSKDIQLFMNKCLGCIKSYQSNLLYFRLL